jgi:dimethylaniline monooxygenase (N-oxide forming)
MDELLADMDLETFRGCKGWLWPFTTLEISDIATVGEERRIKREQSALNSTPLNGSR